MNASLVAPARLFRAFLLLASLAAAGAHAQLTIDITTSGGRQVPIAITPMRGDSSQPQSVSEVVGADLAPAARRDVDRELRARGGDDEAGGEEQERPQGTAGKEGEASVHAGCSS